jgi:hypothetical protein
MVPLFECILNNKSGRSGKICDKKSYKMSKKSNFAEFSGANLIFYRQ